MVTSNRIRCAPRIVRSNGLAKAGLQAIHAAERIVADVIISRIRKVRKQAIYYQLFFSQAVTRRLVRRRLSDWRFPAQE